jgi:hypothetical protein
VPRPKSEKVRLTVFKGKEAKHNVAILCSLKQKSPQTAWELFIHFKKQKKMADLTYTTVLRRMAALQLHDYIMKVGEKDTMPGTEAALYQLSPRGELAVALSRISLDKFVEKAGYDRILGALEVFENWKQ